MPNITPIQSDFSVGEVAPDVQYRSTLEARNRGVLTLTNFLPDSRGPVIRRAGFRFLGKVGEAVERETVCDYDIVDVPISSHQYPNDFDADQGDLSLERDGSYMVQAGAQSQQVFIVRNNNDGTWTVVDTITEPPFGDWDTFGSSVAHSTSAGILIVGDAFSDEAIVNGGRVAVYTGSNAGGWTFSEAINPPADVGSPVARGYFGTRVGISENGQVMAVSKPNNDEQPTFHQAIHIYDHNGDGTFNYRNQIYEYVGDPSTDAGKGDGGLKFSLDGKLLISGDSRRGPGSIGRVMVYDDIGGVFTLRQQIDPPSLVELGRDGEGFIDTGIADTQYGYGVGLSDDNESLVLHMPSFTTFATSTRTGLNVLYKRNPNTNLYEVCDSWYYDDNQQSYNVGLLDMIFNNDLKLLAIAKVDVAINRKGGFKVHEWDAL